MSTHPVEKQRAETPRNLFPRNPTPLLEGVMPSPVEKRRTAAAASEGLQDRVLSYAGVTALTSLSESTIRRLVRAGKLPPPTQITTGRVGFRESDVRAFLASVRSANPDAV